MSSAHNQFPHARVNALFTLGASLALVLATAQAASAQGGPPPPGGPPIGGPLLFVIISRQWERGTR